MLFGFSDLENDLLRLYFEELTANRLGLLTEQNHFDNIAHTSRASHAFSDSLLEPSASEFQLPTF